MQQIKDNLVEARKILDEFISDDQNINNIVEAGRIMVNAVSNNKKILSCGNGGSMCDAMHFAEELTGLFREERRSIPAISISDPSHLTCAANDYGFENIFSRYIEGVGQSGDVLLAISTSGDSQNVVNAAVTARTKNMTIIGLTGKEGGKLAPLCDIEIRAPYTRYTDRTQEIHIKVIHSLIHYIESNI
ncbi:MAG: D-sedoheptulose 7-phosphate isomerase [Bacteroidales bacterium]|nr:MAG: D-sedoheptulose 7-phosphate isomerase [Bacteroidales bacterium]